MPPSYPTSVRRREAPWFCANPPQEDVKPGRSDGFLLGPAKGSLFDTRTQNRYDSTHYGCKGNVGKSVGGPIWSNPDRNSNSSLRSCRRILLSPPVGS